MSAVAVFVDDAVRGWLPPVCAKDGVPTGDRIVINQQIGSSSLGVAWILLLLGPLGWIGLMLIAASRGRDEVLTVQVPLCEDDYQQLVAARRSRNWCVAGSVAIGVIWLALAIGHVANTTSGPGLAWAGLVAIAVLVILGLQAQWRLGRCQIGVHLDASRRWVTLTDVHPTFVAAVDGDRMGTRQP